MFYFQFQTLAEFSYSGTKTDKSFTWHHHLEQGSSFTRMRKDILDDYKKTFHCPCPEMSNVTSLHSPLTRAYMTLASCERTGKCKENNRILVSGKFTTHSYFLFLHYPLAYFYPISFFITTPKIFENSVFINSALYSVLTICSILSLEELWIPL